jgi:hypothetical protein
VVLDLLITQKDIEKRLIWEKILKEFMFLPENIKKTKMPLTRTTKIFIIE